MNENPGEMPNPLNPAPGPMKEPMNNPLDANPAETQPLEEVVEEVQTISVAPTANGSMATPATDPMSRPMEQAPVVQPVPPKKKTGLIVGIIIAVVLLVGGGIAAAILIMNMNKVDPVAKALEKIVTGNAPANVAVDGSFTLTPNDEDSLVSNIQIQLNSEVSTSSMLNASTASVSMNFENADPISFDFEEVYAANGDLYFKVDGLTTALEDYATAMQNTTLNSELDLTEVECAEGEECEAAEVTTDVLDVETNCVDSEDVNCAEYTPDLLETLSGYFGIFEIIDGTWLRISTDDLSGATDLIQTNSDTSCLVDFVSNMKDYNNSVAEMYNKNPFITSTAEGVAIPSKSGEPVYKITVDSEKFNAFIQEFQNSALVSQLFNCMGYDNTAVNIDDVVAQINNLPTFYVELDKEYNFTRLYFVSDLNDGDMTLTSDIGFKYPTNINVAEPEEYRDFSDMIQEIFTSMYLLPDETVEVTE